MSVCVGYSDLVLLTKCLWEIKSIKTRGFNTTIAACVFDLVSIQNGFVAFLELKIVKCKIIYIIIHSKYFPDSDWLKEHV